MHVGVEDLGERAREAAGRLPRSTSQSRPSSPPRGAEADQVTALLSSPETIDISRMIFGAYRSSLEQHGRANADALLRARVDAVMQGWYERNIPAEVAENATTVLLGGRAEDASSSQGSAELRKLEFLGSVIDLASSERTEAGAVESLRQGGFSEEHAKSIVAGAFAHPEQGDRPQRPAVQLRGSRPPSGSTSMNGRSTTPSSDSPPHAAESVPSTLREETPTEPRIATQHAPAAEPVNNSVGNGTTAVDHEHGAQNGSPISPDTNGPGGSNTPVMSPSDARSGKASETFYQKHKPVIIGGAAIATVGVVGLGVYEATKPRASQAS